MSGLWQPPAGMRIEPGGFEGLRRAVCDRCCWRGESRSARGLAQTDAEAHACDPRDVERVQLRNEARREPVLWMPTA